MNVCEWCRKETGNPKFCSLSCSAKQQRSAVPKLPKQSKSCEQCGREFTLAYSTDPKRFCSRSCSASFNNRHAKPGRGPLGTCASESCESRVKRVGASYCSNRCSFAHRRQELISRFLSGENVSTANRKELPRAIRNYLLDLSGQKCSRCGWSEVSPTLGRVPLQVDHEDGDASNNTINNLRVLCPNCHSLTPTFGAQNIGRGRAWRYNKEKREK